MEGKKKKHKKKKGYQTKVGNSVSTAKDVDQTKPYDSVSNSEILPYLNYGSAPEQNQHREAPSNADAESVGVLESDTEQERRKNLEEECVELQEEINKLEDEKGVWSQKEGSLEERIKILQNEVDFCIQREATLEERVKRIEGDHEYWTIEKGSIKDMICKLGDANEGLSMQLGVCQVMELKESRVNLAQENKHLTEKISKLELQIQHLETAASFYAPSKIFGGENTSLKTTDGSVEADLHEEETVEEVSEFNVETDQQAVAGENLTSEKTFKNWPMKSAAIDCSSEFQESVLESNEEIRAMARAHKTVNVNGLEDFRNIEQSRQIQLLGLDDSRISEDVVSVPLDDIIQEAHPPGQTEPGPAVPFSDAPLIGAPFRLISFVTRYVSGADLIDKPKAGR